jgi:hypothetical protein
MDHVGERAELVFQAHDRRGVGAEQFLESDDLVAVAIEGLVDDAHAAGTNAPLNGETAARKHHGLGHAGTREIGRIIALESTSPMSLKSALAAAVLVTTSCLNENPSDSDARKETPPHQPPLQELASPAGPGAGEPFLFTTQTGVGLSWLEPIPGTDRTALRFALFHDDGWTPPRTVIERSDLFVNWADFPSSVSDAGGTLFAHWLQKSGSGKYAYDVRMAVSSDGGATWSDSFLLNRDGRQSEHGFVTLSALPGGGVGAAWLDGRNMTVDGHDADHGEMTLRYATVERGGRIVSDEVLDPRTCECCTTGLTMAKDGPVIVYRDRSEDEIRDVYLVRKSGNRWTRPQPVRSDGWKIDGCPVNGPQIDAIGATVVTAWFTSANDRPRVHAAWSEDGGGTFSDAIPVDDGKPAGRVDVVLLDERTAVVSWLEQTAGGAQIRARRVFRGRRSDPSVRIADSATARATGFTRLVTDGRDVWFAWTEQEQSIKRVRVARTRF